MFYSARDCARRRSGGRWLHAAALMLLAATMPVEAQETGAAGSSVRIGVIDVQRLLTESQAGRAALDRLRALRDQKQAEVEAREQEISDLRARIAEGQLSLSESRIGELEKDLEEKVIAFGRFQDDAERELQKRRDESFAEIERQVIPIITRAGKEMGFTVILNKYQSGLLYARDEADITAEILQRYDAGRAQQQGQGGGG